MRNPTSIAYQAASEMSLGRRLWQKAIIEAKQAIDLDPNDANSHLGLGQVLIYCGRPKEAVEYLKRAMRLDPHYPAHPLLLLGEAHFCMGQFEETVNLIERASKHNPELVKRVYQGRGYITLAAAYGHLGRYKEAQATGGTSIPLWWMQNYPFMHSEDASRLAHGLIKAGASAGYGESYKSPKTFRYIKLFNENKLNGEEIRALVFGREVVVNEGWVSAGGFIHRSKDGEATYQSITASRRRDIGKSWIEDDMLCDQWQKRYEGQKICYAVFRNPDATPADPAKYLYIIDPIFWTFGFKPMD